MHVGAFHAAQRDFQYATSLADGSDPVPSYALGLCSIALRDYDDAELHLTDAEALADDNQRTDVHFADAILAVAKGDYADAKSHTIGINTPRRALNLRPLSLSTYHTVRISDRFRRLSIPPK